MSLAEGVQSRISYKINSSGVIVPATEPVPSSNPGASGGQILRRVSSTIDLSRAAFQSSELRTDRQIADYRLGGRKVAGSIKGELSPLTYQDLMKSVFRATWEASVSITPSEVTSFAFNGSAGTITATSGDLNALGLKIGHILRFTGLADTANNSTNFLITGMDSTKKILSVYPAPNTHTAEASFACATAGKRLYVPPGIGNISFVDRLWAVEEYAMDIAIARLYTECRWGSMSLSLPPSGMATAEFGLMGRDMFLYSASQAPFFTSPGAVTTTGLLAGVNGMLMIGGIQESIVTGLTIDMDLKPSADAVVGSTLPPEIFLGTAAVKGQVTAYFQDASLINDFLNETEISLLAYLTGTPTVEPQGISIYLPRIKLGGASVPLSGEGGQVLTLPFQALKYEGSAAGVDDTTIQICDTEATASS